MRSHLIFPRVWSEQGTNFGPQLPARRSSIPIGPEQPVRRRINESDPSSDYKIRGPPFDPWAISSSSD
ncbi:hypothetical protein M8J75_006899 [Diaphorina citri]|nr:hypothetical protein M8J75_006899 [Diaphorina citri]